MPATASGTSNSPTRLPTSRSGTTAASKKPSQMFLNVAAATAGPTSPVSPGKTTNNHLRSPSKLPRSPGLNSASASSPRLPKQRSPASTSANPSTKVGAPPTKSSAAAEKTSMPGSKSNSSSKAPKPKITVTPSPPESPKKTNPQQGDPSASVSQTIKPLPLTPKDPSPYIAAHMGEPCTLKSLDHRLDCGHKIITTQPESCASNCRISNSAHANPRSLDRPFACLTCIVAEQQTRHAERVNSFKEELQQVAKATKKPDSERWIEAKVGLMEQAWCDLENEEMIAAAKEGRFCYPVYVDQESEGAMVAVVGSRLTDKARKQVENSKAAVDEEMF